jgi:hypothetical protein
VSVKGVLFGQKYRPIGLILMGGGAFIPFTFGLPYVSPIRPQDYQLVRPARGQVIHTVANAFLDTFGPGVPILQVSGHTGWGGGGWQIPGIIHFKGLEFLFNEYHARQIRLAKAGTDPAVVQLWWLDTLNLQALSIYPLQFLAKKTSNRPLLFFYSIQAAILLDLLQDPVGTFGGGGGAPSAAAGNAGGLTAGLTGLQSSFTA